MIQMTCLTKLQVKIKGENPVISRYISILAISLKQGCCQTENGTLVTGQTFHCLFCLAPDHHLGFDWIVVLSKSLFIQNKLQYETETTGVGGKFLLTACVSSSLCCRGARRVGSLVIWFGWPLFFSSPPVLQRTRDLIFKSIYPPL